MKPLIGVTTAWSPELDMEGVLDEFYYINCCYSKAITRAGGIPVLMPPLTDTEADLDAYADELLSRLDAVYFSGGGTVAKRKTPRGPLPLYRQQPVRSAWEDILVKKAYALDMPMLGACRGHQMIAEALGGALHQDNFPAHKQTNPYHEGHHTVNITPGSLLGKIVGEEDWFVNSIHTQKAEFLPEGFIVSARTENGDVEAIESTEKTFVIGTQFHPEMLVYDVRGQKVLQAYVAAAVEYSKRK